MRQAQPGGFAAYIDTGEEQVLSVSPELFFDWHDGHLITRPMKGTAPRDDDPQTDAALALALRTSPKERAENVMIVDLVRNDLSRVSQIGSIEVPSLLRVEEHPALTHLVSTVTGQIEPGLGWAEILAATFPPRSARGAPKSSALTSSQPLSELPAPGRYMSEQAGALFSTFPPIRRSAIGCHASSNVASIFARFSVRGDSSAPT